MMLSCCLLPSESNSKENHLGWCKMWHVERKAEFRRKCMESVVIGAEVSCARIVLLKGLYNKALES